MRLAAHSGNRTAATAPWPGAGSRRIVPPCSATMLRAIASLSIGSVDGRAVIVRPGTGNAFSGDQICVRGRYHYDSLKARERLSKHLVRRGQIQAPARFADAVAEAAAALKAAAQNGHLPRARDCCG